VVTVVDVESDIYNVVQLLKLKVLMLLLFVQREMLLMLAVK
jgi:hypothetical protein